MAVYILIVIPMYIVLVHDVPGLGSKHSLLNVRRGYFSNYLAPRRLAVMATEHLLDDLKSKMIKKKTEEAKILEQVSDDLQKIVKKRLTVSAKASAKGNLYRALGVKTVLDAINDVHGITLSKTDVELEPIKTIGEHVVNMKVKGQQVAIKILVEAKKE